MARTRTVARMINCPSSSLQASRTKSGGSDYDIAFKLTRQSISSREGEIVLLFIPKCDDGAKKPAARRKTSAR
jgi:hypothetical protein